MFVFWLTAGLVAALLVGLAYTGSKWHLAMWAWGSIVVGTVVFFVVWSVVVFFVPQAT